jgi:type I restriction enzyme R subunit
MSHGTESEFELATIGRLKDQGYQHVFGPDILRPEDEVVLKDVLRAHLAGRYPDLPTAALDEAVARISRPEGTDTLRRNKAFHEMLTRGFELRVERPGKKVEQRHIYPVNWEDAEANDFRVVNQLAIHGKQDRRPDLLVYINGLPLVLFELKNPYSEHPSVEDAFNQIQHYGVAIPQVFEFNVITVVSDGPTTLHGVWTAAEEWYAPWKSIDGERPEPNTTGAMKTLIEGLFQKERLLSYIRHFVMFETANEKITKKGAKYHQFFAVRMAAQRTITAFQDGGDKRLGLIWHTTGSGKSLSMAFLVGMLRRRLGNATFLIQVDRNDLDDQLHDQFVLARSLVGEVKHAETVDDLRSMLQTQGGEIIFTTIEKFRLKADKGEVEHPVLSTRSDIIVIADEAHRSQYGFLQGFARYLSDALPNAKRLGFTGTPISIDGADTEEVFGHTIHTYDIKQSQEDNATVPIYYAPRQVKLHLSRKDLDAAFKEVADGAEPAEQALLEKKVTRWTALAAAAGAKERLEKLAGDLLAHYLERQKDLVGKAMIVCMTRQNCVRMYDALTKLPGCPEVKVVMTGNLSTDPKEWSEAGHLTTKPQRDAIKKRMVDPDDPLRIVIVCDMWLTGTDIPCLHTLYIDKPMRGHNMIQAISRVNRVFRDKPHGLIVDYIGIGDELREATDKYSKGGGEGEPAPEISELARPVFLDLIEQTRAALPTGKSYGAWRKLSRIALEDLYALVFGTLADDDQKREQFLKLEMRLTRAFLLVKHLDDCRCYADEVIFYQRARNQLQKTLPGKKISKSVEKAVRDLVDDSIQTDGVVDIFKVAGIEKADVSILDEKFLQTFKDKKYENLRLKLLEKLINDELGLRRRRNLAKNKSFRDLLEKTLQRYHQRVIDAAAVVKAMIQIQKEINADDERAKKLDLSDEELAFYDAVAENKAAVYDEPFLRELIHAVVVTIKRNLKVKWTERAEIVAAVRSAVKKVLFKQNVREEDFEPFLERIMQQAVALFEDYPSAA